MNPQINLEEDSVVFRVPGDLVSTNAENIQSQINTLLELPSHERGVFKLDLSAASMVDSVGLNMVVALFKRLRKSGTRLQVLYSSQNVLRTFTFTRLDTHVEMKRA